MTYDKNNLVCFVTKNIIILFVQTKGKKHNPATQSSPGNKKGGVLCMWVEFGDVCT